MTEHSKIPLPPEGERGTSLFERAEGAFGSFGGLKAAPVPAELAPATNRLVPAKPTVQQEPESPSRMRQGLGVGL